MEGPVGAPLLPLAEHSPRSGRKGDDGSFDRTYIARWSAVTWWRWVMFGFSDLVWWSVGWGGRSWVRKTDSGVQES